MLAIVALGEGHDRFGALKRRMEGVSSKMLGQTLRALERDGLIERTVEPGHPVQIRYGLTPLGDELLPLARSLKRWAEERLPTILEHNQRWDDRDRD